RIQTAHGIRIQQNAGYSSLAKTLLRTHSEAQRSDRRRCLLHLVESRKEKALRRTKSVPIVRLPNPRLDEAQFRALAMAAAVETVGAGLPARLASGASAHTGFRAV